MQGAGRAREESGKSERENEERGSVNNSQDCLEVSLLDPIPSCAYISRNAAHQGAPDPRWP